MQRRFLKPLAPLRVGSVSLSLEPNLLHTEGILTSFATRAVQLLFPKQRSANIRRYYLNDREEAHHSSVHKASLMLCSISCGAKVEDKELNMLLVTLGLFAVLIAVYVRWFYRYVGRHKGLAAIPGPPPAPLFASSFYFASSLTGTVNIGLKIIKGNLFC